MFRAEPDAMEIEERNNIPWLRRLTGRAQMILFVRAHEQSDTEVPLPLDIAVRSVGTQGKKIKRKRGIFSSSGLTRYAPERGALQEKGLSLCCVLQRDR